jgi:leader peptidase (prepilin peptidase)/N-methyltransferase
LFAGFLWAIGALFKLVVRVIGAVSRLFKLSRLREMMRRREDLDYLGLGDVKLLLLLGIFLGLQNCLSALLIGSLAGSIISIVFLIVRRKSLFTELPYGTFLCAGAALVPLLLKT